MNIFYNQSSDQIKEIIIDFGTNIFKSLELDKLSEEEVIKKYGSYSNNINTEEIEEQYEKKIKSITDNHEIILHSLQERLNDFEINKDKTISERLKTEQKLHELEKRNLNNEIIQLKENNRLTELIEDKICDKKEFNNPTEQGDYVEKIFDEIVEEGLKYDPQATIHDTSDYGGSGDRLIKFSNGNVLMIEVKNKDTIKKSDVDEFKKCYEKDFRENKIDCALFFSYRTTQIPNVCKAIIPKYFEDGKVLYFGIDDIPNDNYQKINKRKNMENIIEIAYNSTNDRKTKILNENTSNVDIYNNYLSILTSNKDNYNKELRESQKKTKQIEEKLSDNDKKMNNLYRDIQTRDIKVDNTLLDDKLYKAHLIERIKGWKTSSKNGNSREWKKHCIDELKLGERDISKIKNIKIGELN